MSGDNGIYILQSLDGYRITHAQSIDNLYWWEVDDECNKNLPIMKKQNELNPEMLLKYFGKCTIYDTEKEVLEEASNIYEEITRNDISIIE